MLKLTSKHKLIFAAVLTLLVAVALPTAAFGQKDRGRNQDRGYDRGYDRDDDRDYDRDDDRRDDRRKNRYSKYKKKSGKFINGHDARDGRWDGRGPRRHRSFNRRNRYYPSYGSVYGTRTRTRTRGYYRDRFYGAGSQRRNND